MTATHLFRGNERGEILDASGKVVGRIVPVEPTEAMVTAARETFGPHTEDTESDYLRIMRNGLSAAPTDWSSVAVRVPERIKSPPTDARMLTAFRDGWNAALDAIGVKR